MGTNSIGWAVTDNNYKLLRAKGKEFWGIHCFDEAQVAVDRRSKRISRRRRAREVARIGELKAIFAERLYQEDPEFLIRLDNSKYYMEDKSEELKSKNGIFDDTAYKDSDYYEQFPTIFHLRKALIEDALPYDSRYARLVYLAILNMFKHRGHFLNVGLGGDIATMQEVYTNFVDLCQDLIFVNLPLGVEKDIEKILSDRGKSRTVKKERIANLFQIDKKDKKGTELIKLICGLKADASKIFEDVELEETKTINFGDMSFEENAEELEAAIGTENFELVEFAKQIYNIGTLAGMLRGYKYLSEARVEDYEKHKQDLKKLKEVYLKYKGMEAFDEMFRKDGAGSYSAYIKSVNSSKSSNGPCRRKSDPKGRDVDSIYAKIKKDLQGIEATEVQEILQDIETGTFIPKQLTRGNGVIPYQVHERELEAILNNAQKYLPFLSQIDETCGLTSSEKIIKLFSFQIPYYVGPLTEKSAIDGGNGWVVRKESGKVYPWNMDQKIYMHKTQEAFIKRLIRECTYLSGEKVLPKASLTYEKFAVLNEINNIKIANENISVELKQKIYNELFCRGKKVTRKSLENFLKNENVLTDSSQLTGIDININNSLASWGKFYAIFGEKLKEDKYFRAAERIIELSTIYGDSKKTLKKCLQDEMGDLIDDAKLKRVMGYRFEGWGRLSRELIELSGCDKTTGEIRSIIQTMWGTNDNFMEIIHSDRYTYIDELENKKKKIDKTLSGFTAKDLDDYYFSAPVKRMINRTLRLLNEIIDIMGYEPKKIFVEMTRSDDNGDKNKKGGRSKKRSKALLELYKKLKDETRDWQKEIEDAGESGKLKTKKLYLYYLQMGRCMYTGHEISLDELFTTKYDIDHIYPRQFVKDDNLANNLVLVEKESNAYKSNKYPLENMESKVYSLWDRLHKIGLMNDEKYKRLTGKAPLTEEQLAGFIARQLVETSQGTKGIADLLKQLMPNSQVVYVKGGNVSDFRHDYGFLKSRIVNNLHHAKDAYLNIVVGNVYDIKFTRNPMNFIKKEYSMDKQGNHYNLGKMFRWNVVRGSETAWIGHDDEKNGGSIEIVREVMNKNTPLMTRMTYVNTGAFTKETLYNKYTAKPGVYFPQKSSDERLADVTKYGGYSDISTGYFCVVEHLDKKKRVRSIESVPTYMVKRIEKDENELLNYFQQVIGLKDVKIVYKKIGRMSLISKDGYRVYVSGRSDSRLTLWNAVNLCLDQENMNYIKSIENYADKKDVSEKITTGKNIELYMTLLEKHTEEIFSKRPAGIGDKLTNGIDKFKTLKVEEQCYTLNEILKSTAISSMTADLTMIGGSKNSGKMLISKNVSDENHICIVTQSITGIYEKTIDLLTI